jgi:xanthine dehydrogenase YagS FAD-binding subunit
MATVAGNLLQRTRCPYFREATFPCNKREPGTGCAAREGIDRGNAVLGTSEACTAAYPGDWPVALLAFDAVVDVVSPRGGRTVALADVHLEPGDTPHREHTLAPDELILRIRVPVTAAGRASTYLKIRDREPRPRSGSPSPARVRCRSAGSRWAASPPARGAPRTPSRC